jgi:hypothetical protein
MNHQSIRLTPSLEGSEERRLRTGCSFGVEGSPPTEHGQRIFLRTRFPFDFQLLIGGPKIFAIEDPERLGTADPDLFGTVNPSHFSVENL